MNPSKTAVLVDSSANLSAKVVDKFGLIVINQPIMFGNHLYHENVDIDSDEFYRMLKMEKYHPTTSQVSMREMSELFTKLAQQGYEAALCIGISGGVSGFINSVSTAAPSIQDLQVYPFDSRSVLAGTGYMAVIAAQLLANGKDIHEVLDALRNMREQTHVYLALNNVRELQNNGSISNRSSLLESWFGMRPILQVNQEGRLELVGKEHQIANAMDAIEEELQKTLQQTTDQIMVTVVDADDRDRNMKWVTKLKTTYPELRVESTEIGPYFGAYTGRKAIGLIWTHWV